MTDLDTGRRTTISVSDFGPISKAAIELRPLTIFVGPSNTGKSYLAMLIYALSRAISESPFFASRHPQPDRRPRIDRQLSTQLIDMMDTSWQNLSPQDRRHLGTWLKSNQSKNAKTLTPLPTSLQAKMRKLLAENCWFLEDTNVHLAECFGVMSTRDLSRFQSRKLGRIVVSELHHGNSVATLDIPLTNSAADIMMDISPSFDLQVVLPPRTPSSKLFLPPTAFIQYLAGNASSQQAKWILQTAFGETLRCIAPPFPPFIHAPHYLPADRTGIMDAHRVVVGSLVRRASYGGLLRDSPLPDLSGVVADYLYKLINLPERQGLLHGLGVAIETNILNGSIRIEKIAGTNYPAFFYRNCQWKPTQQLSLMRASSMISELAPIVLHLKHIVTPGDLLIIEEPEAHLHPAMQAALAVQLSKLVKHGINVVVTTHSSTLLEQFLNLVQLSKLSESQRELLRDDFATIADAALNEHDVGAWLFNRKSRGGSTVEEVKPNFESGVFPVHFTDTSFMLYNEWQQVAQLLAEGTQQYP